MTKETVGAAMAFKRELESSFLKAAELSGRKQASAVYSLPQQCPLLWLNLNPGGDENSCVVLSDKEIEQGKNEYFDGHGNTSEETGKCLRALFPEDSTNLRSVQGSNVIWQRSSNSDPDKIDLKSAARDAAPFLRRYIRYVAPELIIFGGINSYELFRRVHQADVSDYRGVVMGPYRGRQVRLFLRANLAIPDIGNIKVVAILHPSKRRWREVLEPLREATVSISLPLPTALD